MPWTRFICPDGAEIPIESCIEKCRMECGRCVSLPTLVLFSRGRRMEWKGKQSTTESINGTRYEFLRYTRDYPEAPCDRAFALVGTFHHIRHQKLDLPNTLTEERLGDEDGSGAFDYWGEDGSGLKVMIDYKTYGAYKVNRLLGKKSVEVPTGEVLKSGPNKGKPKTRKEWQLCEPDNFEQRLQCSRYAWLMRDQGFAVDKYFLQVTVRDWTAMSARMYGLDRKIYLIEIPLFDRETTIAFFRAKNLAMQDAMERYQTDPSYMPPVCNDQETWDGKRCAAYCSVWSYCDWGRQIRAELTPNSEGEVDGQVA